MMTDKKQDKTTSAKLLQYLRGSLSDDERYDLETQLEREPALLDTLREMMNNRPAVDALQEDLAEVAQRWQQRRPASASVHRPIWGRVAAAVLCLVAAWAAYQYYEDQTATRLYTTYFDAPTQTEYIASRSESNDIEGYTAAFAAYEDGDYKTSYYAFQRLRDAHPFESDVLQYTALSAMQLGDYALAKQVFDQMLAISPEVVNHAVAHWYLALIHLQENRIAAARTELQWFADNPPNSFTERAKQLTSQLEDGAQ